MSTTRRELNAEQNAIAAYWDDYSERFDSEHDKENLQEWKKQITAIMNEKKTGKVLDVGTGTGFLALLYAELGYDVVGLDISEAMLNSAKEKAEALGRKINYVQGLAEAIPFPDATFDCLVNCRLLWTLPNPAEAFAEWKRVLKSDGMIVSFMPIPTITLNTFRSYGPNVDITLPLINLDETELVLAMKQAGLTNTRAYLLPENVKTDFGRNPWAAIITYEH